MNEERLREAYIAAVEGGAVRPSAAHPSPEALASLARREGPEAARLATLDHVMSCRECRAEFDLLRAVEGADAKLGAARSTGRRAWFVPAALAASLLVAIGLGRMATRPGDDDITRGGETGAISLLRPGAEAIAGDSLTFAWTPAPGARKYSLEVLDAGGRVVLMAETSDTMATPAVATGLPSGDYKWWVRATTSDAQSVRSAVRPLRLTTK
ncbi:MAG: hypothetical protein ABI766_09345 [Gemmatimonadales bacterium]